MSNFRKALWVGTFYAERSGNLRTVHAVGIAPNSNCLIKLEPDLTDVWPPEYSLFYYIPKVVVPALQPFHVEAKFYAKHPVDHFVVTDATGWHTVEVK